MAAIPVGMVNWPGPVPSEPKVRRNVPSRLNAWILWLFVSRTYNSSSSTVSPTGLLNCAGASPDSPNEKSQSRLLASSTTMRLLPSSATKSRPLASARPSGALNWPLPTPYVPTRSTGLPSESCIFCTVQLAESATQMWVPSLARPVGWPGWLPSNVRICLPSESSSCKRSLPESATSTLPLSCSRKRGLLNCPGNRPHNPKLRIKVSMGPAAAASVCSGIGQLRMACAMKERQLHYQQCSTRLIYVVQRPVCLAGKLKNAPGPDLI
mmetsp:Transcript_41715/g.91593  ORF Transcript_41715/g.91593 Transcript_41715/m.91593 type:complete len:267 (-) Transcript_41715:150-950(-)